VPVEEAEKKMSFATAVTKDIVAPSVAPGAGGDIDQFSVTD
jgi:hypothetical protein